MIDIVENSGENNTLPPFSEMLEAARRYAACGLAVVPIPHGEKGPRLSGWQRLATTDQSQHQAWFPAGLPSNIGIITGSVSRVFVLDVDVEDHGLESLAELERQHGALPATPMQLTPTGGNHFIFTLPEGVTIRNSVKKLGKGLDVRGENGVIVGAPSVHPNGGEYRWAEGRAPWDLPVAGAPAWLLGLIEGSKRPNPTLPAQKGALNASRRVVVDPQRRPAYRDDPADAEAVVAGCAAVESLYTHPESHAGDWGWKLGLGIIGRCEDGRRLAHHMSSLDAARYSDAETEAAISYMLDKEGPATCNAFADEMPEACAACPFRHRIVTPLQLGRQPKALIDLQRRHFYATDASAYYDLERQVVKTERDFAATYAHKRFVITDAEGRRKQLKGNPHHVFISSSTAPKVDVLKYQPGQTARVTRTIRGVLVGNTWLNDGMPAKDGDYSLWEEHICWLIPNDEGQREHLLDVIAHSLQRPGVKVKHAVLLITEGQRVGKSTVAKAWAEMLGPSNVLPISNSELASQFQGGMYNKQLVTFEELFLKGRDMYNDLKEFITEEQKRTQMKFKDFMIQQSPLNILALSNHRLPVMIPEADDARWFVIRSAARRMPPEYYERLYGEGWRQLPAWKAFLLKRDLSRFNPAAPPRMTAAKAEMIAASETPFEKALAVALEEAASPVVVPERLTSIMRMQGVPTNVPAVREALKHRGAKPLGRMRVPGGSGWCSPWAVQDIEHWGNASHDVVRAAL